VDSDRFLDEIYRITSIVTETEKKSVPVKASKTLETCSAGTGHSFKTCKTKGFYIYCKASSHLRVECPKLRKKEQPPVTISAKTTNPIAAVELTPNDSTIALVQLSSDRNILIKSSSIKIFELNNRKCNLSALLDTGSPISFLNVYREFRDPSLESFKRPQRVYNVLNNTHIEIQDSVNSHLYLEQLPNSLFPIDLHVLRTIHCQQTSWDATFSINITFVCYLRSGKIRGRKHQIRRNRIISGRIAANCLVL